jgi:hypothetical protein
MSDEWQQRAAMAASCCMLLRYTGKGRGSRAKGNSIPEQFRQIKHKLDICALYRQIKHKLDICALFRQIKHKLDICALFRQIKHKLDICALYRQ